MRDTAGLNLSVNEILEQLPALARLKQTAEVKVGLLTSARFTFLGKDERCSQWKERGDTPKVHQGTG